MLYPKRPRPYKRPSLPEAFIGKGKVFFPARNVEVTELHRLGLVTLAETHISRVQVFEATKGTNIDAIRLTLQKLRR